MYQLFLERTFAQPLTRDDIIGLVRESSWCFEMYRVDWHGSLLSSDGRSLMCRFGAADAESVRRALKRAEANMTRLWPGSVHEAPETVEPNVLVERSFSEPASLNELQAAEDSHQWCLDTRNVKFVRTYFSSDNRRMLCLYQAPDAESVREAQREAGLPLDRVWSFDRIGPEHVAV